MSYSIQKLCKQNFESVKAVGGDPQTNRTYPKLRPSQQQLRAKPPDHQPANDPGSNPEIILINFITTVGTEVKW